MHVQKRVFQLLTGHMQFVKKDFARHVILIGGSEANRTVCVTVAVNVTKLSFFVVFEAAPRGRIENSLAENLPEVVLGICQLKDWMDERRMHIWYKKIWKQNVEGRMGISMILLDYFLCHVQDEFKDKMRKYNRLATIVPAGYACVPQPCDME
eukprot:IDg14778t1